MAVHKMPAEVLAGATALLSNYIPGLSPRNLVEALNTIEHSSMEAGPKTLTIDEACALLHVSRPTLWRQVKLGTIRVKKFGRRVLIPSSEIERFVNAEG